jgi:hypothetical protein
VLESEPSDAEGAQVVRRALEEVSVRLARWGRLREPVRVLVMPDHASLEKAVDRSGYGWLRAWARYDVVFVQSPASWWVGGGASQSQVDELLLHELTHSVMYQLAATGSTWQYKGIPIWFREGMASVTAEQGYRRGSLPELSVRMRPGGGEDPLREAARLYQENAEEVYSAAHYAFAFLVRRYGDDGVKKVLAGMAAGQRFDPAFESALGISRLAFEEEFRLYVTMDGWRSDLGAAPTPLAESF